MHLVETLKSMTIDNPIFITVLILVIWFAPGIVIRRIAEHKYEKNQY